MLRMAADGGGTLGAAAGQQSMCMIRHAKGEAWLNIHCCLQKHSHKWRSTTRQAKKVEPRKQTLTLPMKYSSTGWRYVVAPVAFS